MTRWRLPRLTLFCAILVIGAQAVADAQPAPKRIGWVAQGAAPAGGDPGLADFRQGMVDQRYVEGRDFVLDARYANGKPDQLQQLAADLARQRVDVIVTSGEAAAHAAKRATGTIPIVAIEFGSDPLRAKLVTSLGRPEGNLTGISSTSDELWSKRLGILREIAPKVARVTVLWNPENPGNGECLRAIQEVGRAANLQIRDFKVGDRTELDRTFAALARDPGDALLACWDGVTLEHSRRLAEFARERRLPTLFPVSEYVQAGGLVSYGPDLAALRRRAAHYVNRLFKGAKPNDLPMEQASNFYLVMNQGTAKALGLTFSPGLMLQAEEIVP